MEIVLARHGKPGLPAQTRIAGYELGRWARQYNETGITQEVAPPDRLRELAVSVSCVVASDLRRSLESAACLVSAHDIQIEPELREAGLPESLGLSIRLPPSAWVVAGRVAWWLDWCRSSETITATRARASRAADRLTALARQHGTVLVVGHGMFNRFIATHLVKRGWRGPRILPRPYWSTATFTQTASV
jgi:broad specificity phosphatase PhoE